MYVLDTDHLSILERGGVGSEPLYRRLQTLSPNAVAATVVSYEEQTRGWFSVMAQARSLDDNSERMAICNATYRCFVRYRCCRLMQLLSQS